MAKYFYIFQCSSSKHIRDSRVFYFTNFKELFRFFESFSDRPLFLYWRLQVYERKFRIFNSLLTFQLTKKLSAIRKSLTCRFKY